MCGMTNLYTNMENQIWFPILIEIFVTLIRFRLGPWNRQQSGPNPCQFGKCASLKHIAHSSSFCQPSFQNQSFRTVPNTGVPRIIRTFSLAPHRISARKSRPSSSALSLSLSLSLSLPLSLSVSLSFRPTYATNQTSRCDEWVTSHI